MGNLKEAFEFIETGLAAMDQADYNSAEIAFVSAMNELCELMEPEKIKLN